MMNKIIFFEMNFNKKTNYESLHVEIDNDMIEIKHIDLKNIILYNKKFKLSKILNARELGHIKIIFEIETDFRQTVILLYSFIIIYCL